MQKRCHLQCRLKHHLTLNQLMAGEKGGGLLFANQQMMAAGENTSRLIYAKNTFRMDFTRVVLILSNLDVLTGNQG